MTTAWAKLDQAAKAMYAAIRRGLCASRQQQENSQRH